MRYLMVLFDKRTVLTMATLHSLAIFTAADLTKLCPLNKALLLLHFPNNRKEARTALLWKKVLLLK